MAVVPTQEQGGGQLGLVEHDYVGSLLGDEPVQVLLLLGRVDAAYIPHQDCQGHPGDVEVLPARLLVPLVNPMCLQPLWVVPLLIMKSGFATPFLVAGSKGHLGVGSFPGWCG